MEMIGNGVNSATNSKSLLPSPHSTDEQRPKWFRSVLHSSSSPRSFQYLCSPVGALRQLLLRSRNTFAVRVKSCSWLDGYKSTPTLLPILASEVQPFVARYVCRKIYTVAIRGLSSGLHYWCSCALGKPVVTCTNMCINIPCSLYGHTIHDTHTSTRNLLGVVGRSPPGTFALLQMLLL
jgi:hypothetical protein